MGVVFWQSALAAENADELYMEGRFAEAEEAYADSDMDHPKDIRYRYNRGCAAYQNADYQGAMAAFSSVLRRAEDKETQFKASYNLGNTAFKQSDFKAATAHYKQAILYKPENEDAKHNLELAIKEVEKLKQNQGENQKAQPQGESQQTEDQGGQSETEQQGKDSDKPSKDKPSEEEQSRESTQDQEQADRKDQGESEQQAESGQAKGTEQDQPRRTGEETPQDLSGELRSLLGIPEEPKGEETQPPSVSMIDKKKAEALLDNIKEDRSRFLRLQIPQEKKYGVPSGKDW
jgi:Ca-activated chloride channel family protein